MDTQSLEMPKNPAPLESDVPNVTRVIKKSQVVEIINCQAHTEASSIKQLWVIV